MPPGLLNDLRLSKAGTFTEEESLENFWDTYKGERSFNKHPKNRLFTEVSRIAPILLQDTVGRGRGGGGGGGGGGRCMVDVRHQNHKPVNM